jgi:hypothetical protein
MLALTTPVDVVVVIFRSLSGRAFLAPSEARPDRLAIGEIDGDKPRMLPSHTFFSYDNDVASERSAAIQALHG